MTHYVVFHKDTTRYLSRHPKVKTDKCLFASPATAKAALTREVNRGAVKREDFLIDTIGNFVMIEKKETVKNLMSGKEVVQSVNTPWCCNPASETYWSM